MPFRGIMRVPSDKSISHRAVLFAGLASGTSHLERVLPSADVHATIDAMRALGAQLDFEQGEDGLSGAVTGIALSPRVDGAVRMDCGNSGTTARLLLGVLAGLGVDATLLGDASLQSRPMERVMAPLRMLGARFESDEGTLPVRVLPGRVLEPGQIVIDQASAQVKSAVLLAGMQADGITSITEPNKSRDHTELLLPAFGVPVQIEGLTARVAGPASMHAHDMRIPSDPSSASFVAVAATLAPGSDVLLEQVALNPTRTGAFEVLERMGADIAFDNESFEGCERVGDVRVRSASCLKATHVTPQEVPTLIDEIPILSVAAACASGETVFERAGELRVKESDRLSAIVEGLHALGVEAFAEGDDLHVIGDPGLLSAERGALSMPTHGDHRLAMTWHLAGLVLDARVELDDRSCVAVSWPGFFEDIESLRC